MSELSDITIAEPSVQHYEAFIEACKKMQNYVNNKSQLNDVAKSESKGFIFARDGYTSMSKEDFEKIIVNEYKEKSKPDAEKPEYFRFIMCGDTIVGSINARAKIRDEFDNKNGLRSCKKWDYISDKGIRVTTSNILLPEYRGQGIIGKAEKIFFDELYKEGIREITATVLSNNDSSNRAHEKMVDNYGGKVYFVFGDPNGSGIKHYKRYVISTDTSGNSKKNYNTQSLSSQVAVLRGIGDHKPLKPVNPTTLSDKLFAKTRD